MDCLEKRIGRHLTRDDFPKVPINDDILWAFDRGAANAEAELSEAKRWIDDVMKAMNNEFLSFQMAPSMIGALADSMKTFIPKMTALRAEIVDLQKKDAAKAQTLDSVEKTVAALITRIDDISESASAVEVNSVLNVVHTTLKILAISLSVLQKQ